MDINQKNMAFVTGTGRCGTATIATILSKAKNSIVMHEGKVEPPMDKEIFCIKPLFVENLEAYLNPNSAEDILNRKLVPQLNELSLKFQKIEHFCDVAFYYSPFVSVIPNIFSKCRLAIIVRDGRHYVRSSTTTQVPDPKPIGYGPADSITCIKSPSLFKGRLRPIENSDLHNVWSTLTPFQKNSWVWAETNRILLDQISKLDTSTYKIFYFEELFSNSDSIQTLLKFLGFKYIDPAEINNVLTKKLNAREIKTLSHPDQWTIDMKNQFNTIAGDMMTKLGYY